MAQKRTNRIKVYIAGLLCLIILALFLEPIKALGGGEVWSAEDRKKFEEAKNTEDAITLFHNTFAKNLPSATEVGGEDISTMILYTAQQIAQIRALMELKEHYLADKMYNGVPYFCQGHYKETEYSWDDEDPTQPSTVAAAGCGITCFSMLLSHYLEEQYPPTYTAYVANVHGIDTTTSWDSFGQLAELFNLEFLGWHYGPKQHYETVTVDSEMAMHRIRNHLHNGNLVIASMAPNEDAPEDEREFWTSGGHYVLLCGMTADWKFMVSDPASYDRTEASPYDEKYIRDYCKVYIVIKNPNNAEEEGD